MLLILCSPWSSLNQVREWSDVGVTGYYRMTSEGLHCLELTASHSPDSRGSGTTFLLHIPSEFTEASSHNGNLLKSLTIRVETAH